MAALEQNMYLVEYRLIVNTDMTGVWCQEKVRCIAKDRGDAKDKVCEWALLTPFIWSTDGDEVQEYQVPLGPRDVSIIYVEEVISNVGPLVESLGMSSVFAYEG